MKNSSFLLVLLVLALPSMTMAQNISSKEKKYHTNVFFHMFERICLLPLKRDPPSFFTSSEVAQREFATAFYKHENGVFTGDSRSFKGKDHPGGAISVQVHKGDTCLVAGGQLPSSAKTIARFREMLPGEKDRTKDEFLFGEHGTHTFSLTLPYMIHGKEIRFYYSASTIGDQMQLQIFLD